ncbi:DUF1127 domain-containing protein [Inquilinus limosus]|uniref:DUF1127 domain-containing protein n=1 Tax=Inquilinus limosus TaxID=171674 RepID=UPI00047C94A8|nr:DUF1127 domain-containing protein [Inquilinus limosus]
MDAPTLAGRIGAPADGMTVHRETGWITAIAGKIAIVMTRQAHARRTAEAFTRLNNHMLQDIGFTRAEAVHTVLFGCGTEAGRHQPSQARKEP